MKFEDVLIIKAAEFKYETEYGVSMPIRFLETSQVKMYDAEGKEVFCSCGKSAGSAIIGKDSFIAMCTECMYGNESVTK